MGRLQTGLTRQHDRNRDFYGNLLMRDYFVPTCTYTADHFRRRFWMRRSLFLRILDSVVQTNAYFVQKFDACAVTGLTPHQKICTCVHLLATGQSANSMDKRYRMGESTLLKLLKLFCAAVINAFGA